MTPDEIEAETIKYNIARVVRLSSGNFALYHPFRNNEDGLVEIHIGPAEEIFSLIPTAEECFEWVRGREAIERRTDDERRLSLADLGLAKPTQPFRRRV